MLYLSEYSFGKILYTALFNRNPCGVIKLNNGGYCPQMIEILPNVLSTKWQRLYYDNEAQILKCLNLYDTSTPSKCFDNRLALLSLILDACQELCHLQLIARQCVFCNPLLLATMLSFQHGHWNKFLPCICSEGTEKNILYCFLHLEQDESYELFWEGREWASLFFYPSLEMIKNFTVLTNVSILAMAWFFHPFKSMVFVHGSAHVLIPIWLFSPVVILHTCNMKGM